MSLILNSLRLGAMRDPDHLAIVDDTVTLGYAALHRRVEATARRLAALESRAIALFADNSVAWVVADLAAMWLGIPIVPLPLFASPGQITHALQQAGVDCVITDRPAYLCELLPAHARVEIRPFGEALFSVRVITEPVALPARTWKITFTSGTTGDPKGVCLSLDMIERTASALCRASAGTHGDRHLCTLPLATLLENIGGVYAPLLAGATAYVPALASVGLDGSSSLDVAKLAAALRERRATTAILVPAMLSALTAFAADGRAGLDALRFLAVGGARVLPADLERALTARLPVFEGYGLSECGSVVALNRAGACRPGSVGRPLPHVHVEIAADGEIIVLHSTYLGYLGDRNAPPDDGRVATGDLGYLDAAGFLNITGRKRNVFITAFGRNVSPEWVENELVATLPIAQAAVFGEARPFNTAVLVPRAGATQAAIASAIAEVNRRLPDYARVHAWLVRTEPFTPANGLLTANGRLRRHAIHDAHAAPLDALYAKSEASAA